MLVLVIQLINSCITKSFSVYLQCFISSRFWEGLRRLWYSLDVQKFINFILSRQIHQTRTYMLSWLHKKSASDTIINLNLSLTYFIATSYWKKLMRLTLNVFAILYLLYNYTWHYVWYGLQLKTARELDNWDDCNWMLMQLCHRILYYITKEIMLSHWRQRLVKS